MRIGKYIGQVSEVAKWFISGRYKTITCNLNPFMILFICSCNSFGVLSAVSQLKYLPHVCYVMFAKFDRMFFLLS